jgi:hypothetical protein
MKVGADTGHAIEAMARGPLLLQIDENGAKLRQRNYPRTGLNISLRRDE